MRHESFFSERLAAFPHGMSTLTALTERRKSPPAEPLSPSLRFDHLPRSSPPLSPCAPIRRLPGTRIRQKHHPYSPNRLIKSWSSETLSESMVYRESHPLNVGKRLPYLSGLPGKLYYKNDRVTPIVDDILMFHASSGWCQARLKEEAEPLRGAVAVCLVEKHMHVLGLLPAPPVERGPLCNRCGSRDPRDFTPTKDKDADVCKCGAVCARVFKSLYRDKNCTEDDDKTQRSERPVEQRWDRFDHAPPSADEARKEREREQRSGFIGKKAKQRLGLGYAPENCARLAAQSERERQEMEPRDQNKELQILTKLEELFAAIHPMDDRVKRYCRVQTYSIWRRAVKHASICKSTGCQLNIKNRGPPVIAESALICSLQRLLQGGDVIEGVSHCTVLALNEKVGVRSRVNGSTASHRAVRTQVASLLASVDDDCMIEPCPSERSSSFSRSGSETSLCGPDSGLPRSISTDSDVGSELGADIIKLRDGILIIFRMLSSQMPISVHRAAMTAVAAPAFRSGLASLRTSSLATLSLHALSFVILESVAREHETVNGGSSRQGATARLLHSLGLTADAVESAVEVVRHIPPAAVVHPVSETQDGLFG